MRMIWGQGIHRVNKSFQVRYILSQLVEMLLYNSALGFHRVPDADGTSAKSNGWNPPYPIRYSTG